MRFLAVLLAGVLTLLSGLPLSMAFEDASASCGAGDAPCCCQASPRSCCRASRGEERGDRVDADCGCRRGKERWTVTFGPRLFLASRVAAPLVPARGPAADMHPCTWGSRRREAPEPPPPRVLDVS